MQIFKPAYYDNFRCLAGACPDSCCKEWDVQVDAATAARYRALPGALGDRLRQVMYEEDMETYLAIQADRRCPMWRKDGLCRIQAEQGEAALCNVCRDFPRLRHDYGDFVELGLELSCPEAARLILSAQPAPPQAQGIPNGMWEYDWETMAILKETRKTMLSILDDRRYTVAEVLALGLMYGYHAQQALDDENSDSFDSAAALTAARLLAQPGDDQALREFFLGLEILTPTWRAQLKAPSTSTYWPEQTRAMARYFVERYWLQAVSDYDLVARVKLTVVSCLLVKQLGGDFFQTAQLYSKEIENDADNVDAILDGAYTSPALTDAHLLGLLLGNN